MRDLQITPEMILEKDPCREWVGRLREYAGQSKSLLEILEMDDVAVGDRIWLALQFLDDKTRRLFAVWCARQALSLIKNPDQRSVDACDVAERYANGEATEDELTEADAAARSAAWSAAAAAYAVAYAAADAAAYAAADAAAWSAAAAAYAAAYAAARKKQLNRLIEMVKEQL